MLTTVVPTSIALGNSLENAARKLHAARVRSSMFCATEQALSVGSWFVLMSSAAAILGVLRLLPVSLGKWCLAASLLGMVVHVISKVLSAGKVKPDLAETAERLDLAIRGENRIAISYELSKTARRSEFSHRALADGLRLLQTAKELEPVLPNRDFKPSALSQLFLLVGMLVFVATWIWPAALDQVVISSGSSNQSTGNILLQDSVKELNPPISKKLDPSQPRVPSNSAQQKNLYPPESQSALQKNERSENNSTAMTSASQQRPSFAGAAETKPHPDSPLGTDSRHIASNSRQSDQASSPPLTVSAMSASTSPDASAGQPVMGAPGASGSNDAAKSPPGSSGSGSGAGNAESKTGEGQGGKGSGGKALGKGSGSGDAPGEPTSNGKGKGTGQNSLKKSRGVAPEFLGGLDPDTLSGPKLPGPDERTREQISPLQGSGTPAPDTDTNPRSEPETPVLHYDVPADSRSVVSDYFRVLHEQTPQ